LLAKALPILIIFLLIASISAADPIQRIEGVIVDMNHDLLWLKPDNQQETLKFWLRWNVRFNPLRLPLKGDRVQILYKNKEEGLVIYGLNYIQNSSDSSDQTSE
jgi:hypothetical protein